MRKQKNLDIIYNDHFDTIEYFKVGQTKGRKVFYIDTVRYMIEQYSEFAINELIRLNGPYYLFEPPEPPSPDNHYILEINENIMNEITYHYEILFLIKKGET